MSAISDKISAGAKQAVGAITGDEQAKEEGQRQEDRGTVKEKVDSALGRAHHVLHDLKHRVDNA